MTSALAKRYDELSGWNVKGQDETHGFKGVECKDCLLFDDFLI